MQTVKKLNAKLFGDAIFHDFKDLITFAWPSILISFSKSFNFTISIIICGHLSRVELDAVSLSNTTINVFGLCIAMGLSTAMDTIFSRKFGAGETNKLLMLLTKFWILSGCTFLVLASIHIQIESILVLLHQNELVAKLSSYYIMYYLPGLLFDFSFMTFSRYLQNQNIIFPSMIFALFGNFFNATSQYIAIYILNYDYLSSAICQAVSSAIIFFMQLIYVLCCGSQKHSDLGLREALSDWGIFFKLGLPGILMIALETWSFEMSTIAAGAMGVVQLGVQSIIFQVEVIAYMIPLGISIAVNVRVGQHLGAGCPAKARNCFRIGLALVFCTASISCAFIASLSNILPRIFTNDPEVIERASIVMTILAYFQFADGLAAIPSGALRGCGRHVLGAVLIFIGYYAISIPVGFVLAFMADYQVKGMWIGLAIGISIEAVIFIIIVCNTNWDKYAQIATESKTLIDSTQNNTEFRVSESETERLIPSKRFRRSSSHHISYSPRFSGTNNKEIYDHLLLYKGPPPSERSLLRRRLVTIFILMLIFLTSLTVRIVRPELCVPRYAIDNMTDVSYLPFVTLCNDTYKP